MLSSKKYSFLSLIFFLLFAQPSNATCYKRLPTEDRTEIYDVSHSSQKACGIDTMAGGSSQSRQSPRSIKIKNSMNEKVYVRIGSDQPPLGIRIGAKQTATLYVRKELYPTNFTGLVIHDNNSRKRDLKGIIGKKQTKNDVKLNVINDEIKMQ